MMSPESTAKFSHHLTQEMVVGRASTGLFLCLWTPHSCLSASATWLMEHFSLVTSCTEFSEGNRADLGKSQVGTWHCCWQAEAEQQHGSYNTNESRFCTPLANSSCSQELIIATPIVALFTLLLFGGTISVHWTDFWMVMDQMICRSSALFCEVDLNTHTPS